MSTRERWIVYPLLFMTLGIALRDKIVPSNQLRVSEIACDRISAKRSECETLVVNGPAGPVVAAGVDSYGRAGVIETFTVAGVPQIQLHSTDGGGLVSAIGEPGPSRIMLGHLGQKFANGFGVFVQTPDLRAPISLPPTATLRTGVKQTPPKPRDESPTTTESKPDK